MINPNRLKQTLQHNQTAIGTMVAEIRQPVIMQLLANAGFNFVIIDNEHGGFTIETIADLSRAAMYVGLTPIVRVPDITYSYIAQTLDVGAQGLMIPRVTEAEQVRQVVQMMKFPPIGSRGNALSRGYTNFKSGNVIEAMATANQETMLIVQIETREAIENIQEIAAVPQVDALLIGPNDLSIALGTPGELNSAIMQQAMHTVIQSCQQHHLCPALHMNDVNLAAYWAKQGMRLLSSGAEIGLLVKAGLELTTQLRTAWD